jgi:phosphoribulokinase
MSTTASVFAWFGRDGGRPVDFLDIDGGVAVHHVAELEDAIWQHLPDLRPLRADQFGDYQDRADTRHSEPLALTQLLLTYHLLRKYGDLSRMPFAPPVAALSRLQSTSASDFQARSPL